jgi:hypothetical protein
MNTDKSLRILYSLPVLFVLFVSVIRPVNYDEAYYLASGQEILNGNLPYIDFLFHQMPLSIFIYSPISGFGINSLFLGRFLSVVFLVVSFFIFRRVYIKYSSTKNELLFAALFFLNFFMIDWAVLVRIYALSVFLLSLAVFYYDKFRENEVKLIHLFLSGIFFSVLVYVKIIFIINLIIFIIFVFESFRAGNSRKKIFIFITVFSSVLIPALLFFAVFGRNLDSVFFNIFEVNIITKKYIDVSFTKSILKFAGTFLLPQNLVLLTVVVASGFKYSKFEKFLIINTGGFIFIHLFSRMLMEYVSSIIPLLILISVLRYEKFETRLLGKFKILTRKKIAAGTIAIYILFSPFSIEHIKHLIENRDLNLNLIQLTDIEERINSMQGLNILSSWEGYSIFSKKIPLMRQYYGSAFIDEYISTAERIKYRIAPKSEYEDLIMNRIPDIIVYDSSNNAHLGGLEKLIKHNYVQYFEYKTIVVYQKQ